MTVANRPGKYLHGDSTLSSSSRIHLAGYYATDESRYGLNAYYEPLNNHIYYDGCSCFEYDTGEWDVFTGTCSTKNWLDAIARRLKGDAPQRASSWRDNMGAMNLAIVLTREGAGEDMSHLFLDSFSIIENGEQSKRRERIVVPSPCQSVLLSLVRDSRERLISRMTPREFEVLVAHELAEGGFGKVQLRRYSKDDGVDILAVITEGEREELVVVEVKHSRNTVGLKVLDRLNGVRDRLNADRAILVTSGHISSDAKTRYSAKRDHVAAYTFSELDVILHDALDWSMSPRGLWTKRELIHATNAQHENPADS